MHHPASSCCGDPAACGRFTSYTVRAAVTAPARIMPCSTAFSMSVWHLIGQDGWPSRCLGSITNHINVIQQLDRTTIPFTRTARAVTRRRGQDIDGPAARLMITAASCPEQPAWRSALDPGRQPTLRGRQVHLAADGGKLQAEPVGEVDEFLEFLGLAVKVPDDHAVMATGADGGHHSLVVGAADACAGGGEVVVGVDAADPVAAAGGELAAVLDLPGHAEQVGLVHDAADAGVDRAVVHGHPPNRVLQFLSARPPPCGCCSGWSGPARAEPGSTGDRCPTPTGWPGSAR